MTNEEWENAIRCLKLWIEREPQIQTYKTCLEALEQQPCDDEYIKIPKKALKYRTAGMVAYNAEWLKEHWQMELKVMGIECDDAISHVGRLIDLANAIESDDSGYWTNKRISSALRNISSVTQRTNCQYRHENGNCLKVGGFCTSVDDKHCPSVTQKSGKWIVHPEIETSTPDYLMFYECSECGDKQCFCKSDIHKKRFCGNCGCRMVEPQESEDKDADKKCTYKETGCGSCKRQLDCPIEADTTESEDKA